IEKDTTKRRNNNELEMATNNKETNRMPVREKVHSENAQQSTDSPQTTEKSENVTGQMQEIIQMMQPVLNRMQSSQERLQLLSQIVTICFGTNG
ncbi:hypothetical protein L9F63_009314, partial [Diploptera punctata]